MSIHYETLRYKLSYAIISPFQLGFMQEVSRHFRSQAWDGWNKNLLNQQLPTTWDLVDFTPSDTWISWIVWSFQIPIFWIWLGKNTKNRPQNFKLVIDFHGWGLRVLCWLQATKLPMYPKWSQEFQIFGELLREWIPGMETVSLYEQLSCEEKRWRFKGHHKVEGTVGHLVDGLFFLHPTGSGERFAMPLALGCLCQRQLASDHSGHSGAEQIHKLIGFFLGCYTVMPVIPLPRLTSAILDWLAIRFHLGVSGSEAGPGFSRSGATAGPWCDLGGGPKSLYNPERVANRIHGLLLS